MVCMESFHDILKVRGDLHAFCSLQQMIVEAHAFRRNWKSHNFWVTVFALRHFISETKTPKK